MGNFFFYIFTCIFKDALDLIWSHFIHQMIDYIKTILTLFEFFLKKNHFLFFNLLNFLHNSPMVGYFVLQCINPFGVIYAELSHFDKSFKQFKVRVDLGVIAMKECPILLRILET